MGRMGPAGNGVRYSGKDLRVSVKVAGNYATLPGERASAGTYGNEQVDTSTKDGVPWRALSAMGTRFADITASGVVRDDLSRAVWNTVMQAVFDGTPLEVKLESAAGVIAEGLFMVPSLGRAGEYNNAETFDVTFNGTGDVRPVPVVPPQVCVNPAVAYAGTQLAYHAKGWNTGSGGVEITGTILHVSGTRFEGNATAQDLGGDGLPWGAPYPVFIHVDIVCQVVDGIAYYDIIDDWGNRTQFIWQGIKYQPPEWSSPPYTCPVEYSALVDHYSGAYTGGPFQIDATLVDNSFSCDGWVATPYINWYSEYHATITPAPSSLADPALWVGAWETTALDAPNIITGAPGGDFQPESGALMSLGDGGTSVGRATAGSGAHTATVNAAVTDFTIAAFMRAQDTGSLEASSPYMVMGDAAFTTNHILFHTYLESLQVSGTYGTPAPISVPGLWLRSTTFHHYAFVYTASDKRIKCYRDGALVYDVGTTYDLFGGVTPAKFGLFLAGPYYGWMKNPVMTREALSPAAVAALAAGHLPNASGILT